VAHLVFTDGLASVSVFVESSPISASPGTQGQVSGTTRVGSTSAFSTVVEGHRVTAVGEVPPSTVQFIAKAMKSQQAASFNSPQH